MGDVSRHRDIFFNTRDAIPPSLLGKCRLTRGELTYLELGNYLTDVSQFRDPVTYIFAKQRIWRDEILPKVGDQTALRALRALATALGAAGGAALAATGQGKYAAIPVAATSVLQGVFSDDLIAGLAGLDDWIDRMFGKPFERLAASGRKRKEDEYGYVGQFFQHFIEGITHLLFATEVSNKVPGEWGGVDRIPQSDVAVVFRDFFTQYYPHEHTDQPPYVWDASERTKPANAAWYGPSRRQRDLVNRDIGIMNAVDKHYVQYLAEDLSKLEHEWRALKPEDSDKRRKWLVRLGKILHGVEDWFFHSNVVELIRLRSGKMRPRDGEDQEQFVRRFVESAIAADDPTDGSGRKPKRELQRRLYRRLRFPVYERGTRTASAGFVSKSASVLSVHHAYPAFPSQQDTAHTLLAALENLERNRPGDHERTELPPWAPCVLGKLIEGGHEGRKILEDQSKARGVSAEEVILGLASTGPGHENAKAVVIDVFREWLPLVVTLLYENERQRLVADVDPLLWPLDGTVPLARPKDKSQDNVEMGKQLLRHRRALEKKPDAAGVRENNYERAVRYLTECGFLNELGRKALVAAFEIDDKAEKLHAEAPGAGGFLMQFAVELQAALDEGDRATAELNEKPDSVFAQASDNGSFTEIVGSHSLMSKDTKESSPFFDDAKTLASVASQCVCRIMLEEIAVPASDTGVHWLKILWHLIRYPLSTSGWENQALAYFRESGTIPTFDDVPELPELKKAARASVRALEPWRKGTKGAQLEDEYVKLEKKLSRYRHP